MCGDAARVIWLTGGIGSGKSAVGRALARAWPQAQFVDGDDLAGPAHLPNAQRWAIAIRALAARTRRRQPLVVAYPLRPGEFRLIRAACGATRLVVVAVATPLSLALRGRGGRVLEPGERARARQMWSQGYQAARFAAMRVVNGVPPARRTAWSILRRCGRRPVWTARGGMVEAAGSSAG